MTQDRPADPNSPGNSCTSRSIAPARLRHFSENRYIRMIIAGRTGNGTRTAPSIPGESASDGNRSATERPARFPASHETEPNEPKTAKFRTDRRQAQPRARAGHDAGRNGRSQKDSITVTRATHSGRSWHGCATGNCPKTTRCGKPCCSTRASRCGTSAESASGKEVSTATSATRSRTA